MQYIDVRTGNGSQEKASGTTVKIEFLILNYTLALFTHFHISNFPYNVFSFAKVYHENN